MGKRLTVDELEPVARQGTRKALEEHKAVLKPYLEAPNLTLGTLIEDDPLTFDLYIAAERPRDAVILTSTKVCRVTGDVLAIEIHLDPQGRCCEPLPQQQTIDPRQHGAA